MGKRNADPAKVKDPGSGGRLSLRQFAAIVGVDYVSAREALENGRIQFIAGTRLLDRDDALNSWQDTRDHKLMHTDADTSEDAAKISNMTPLGKAKLRKESAVAETKEIELAALKNRYIEKDAVTEAVFKYSRVVRDGVLTIPDRVASVVASEMREAVLILLFKNLDEDSARRIIKGFPDAEVERIVRAAWTKESIDVLKNISNPPKVKNAKRD